MKKFIGEPLVKEEFGDSNWLSFRVAQDTDLRTYIVAILQDDDSLREIGSVEVTNRKQENLWVSKIIEGYEQIKVQLILEANQYLSHFPRSKSLDWFPRPLSPKESLSRSSSPSSVEDLNSSGNSTQDSDDEKRNEIQDLFSQRE